MEIVGFEKTLLIYNKQMNNAKQQTIGSPMNLYAQPKTVIYITKLLSLTLYTKRCNNMYFLNIHLFKKKTVALFNIIPSKNKAKFKMNTLYAVKHIIRNDAVYNKYIHNRYQRRVYISEILYM